MPQVLPITMREAVYRKLKEMAAVAAGSVSW